MDITTLALAKKYVQETVEGAGALKGKDGKSAYQIAIDNGFSGTEQEWLNSLRGGMAGADYDQNDPDGPGYIKNRPFFERIVPAVKSLSFQETADNDFIIPQIEGFDEAEVSEEFAFRKITDYVVTVEDCDTLEMVRTATNDSGEIEEKRFKIKELASQDGFELSATPYGDAIMLSIQDIYCIFCAPEAGTYTGTLSPPDSESAFNVSITVPAVGTYTNVYTLLGEEDTGMDMWFELPERTIMKTIDRKFLQDSYFELDLEEAGIDFSESGWQTVSSYIISKIKLAYESNTPLLIKFRGGENNIYFRENSRAAINESIIFSFNFKLLSMDMTVDIPNNRIQIDIDVAASEGLIMNNMFRIERIEEVVSNGAVAAEKVNMGSGENLESVITQIETQISGGVSSDNIMMSDGASLQTTIDEIRSSMSTTISPLDIMMSDGASLQMTIDEIRSSMSTTISPWDIMMSDSESLQTTIDEIRSSIDAISNTLSNLPANNIVFEDGETLQQKYEQWQQNTSE